MDCLHKAVDELQQDLKMKESSVLELLKLFLDQSVEDLNALTHAVLQGENSEAQSLIHKMLGASMYCRVNCLNELLNELHKLDRPLVEDDLVKVKQSLLDLEHEYRQF